MNFTTPVELIPSERKIHPEDGITLLGSCFADGMASRMEASGLKVCSNPFGTLYNPESILSTLERLESAEPFREDDCTPMGAGAAKICSFSHHSSFARDTAAEFLENANAALAEALLRWKESRWLAVTFGTAMVWRLRENGCTVANCLKRPASEFSHVMLSVEEISAAVRRILELAGERQVIFTVSPVRHPGDGMHANSISKARLLTGLDDVLSENPAALYFPAFEIVLDELRDYRFFADDLRHPSKLAYDYVWERFCDCFLGAADKEKARLNAKRALQGLHRPILK